MIHGEQSYYYKRPLLVGEKLYCYSELSNYYEREGSSGKMGFVEIINYGEDKHGKLIYKVTQILVITESVRNMM